MPLIRILQVNGLASQQKQMGMETTGNIRSEVLSKIVSGYVHDALCELHHSVRTANGMIAASLIAD